MIEPPKPNLGLHLANCQGMEELLDNDLSVDIALVRKN